MCKWYPWIPNDQNWMIKLEGDVDDEEIKLAYRRLAKFYHPDVYNGKGSLEEGETAEARFIKIQAAYELLIDSEEKRKYEMENRANPVKVLTIYIQYDTLKPNTLYGSYSAILITKPCIQTHPYTFLYFCWYAGHSVYFVTCSCWQASQAWMEWPMKKRNAFDQRGDMAIVAWAEQQQRELNIRVRRLSRSKVDPDEERRILAKEKKASIENYTNTLKRHTLVLRKRDLLRKKAKRRKNS
ncbi:putative DnaJ domain, Chaperone J-domain superfamily [Helianthus annuus]|nr:putative DnaJ domain, Chaperone J-domain superfamily [Helianthus annuus]